MIRLLLSSTAAILLLAAPVAANAATTTHKPAMRHMAAKPHAMKASKPAKPRDAGAAATDALNDQSLAKAKAGQ